MTKVIVSSSLSSKIKLDEWENDPYLTANPKRAAMVARGALETLALLGTEPKNVKNLETRKAYELYLKANKK